eukprot:RCo011884
MKVLELFSGIGGMRAALCGLHIPLEAVFAVDNNANANDTYSLNYEDVPSCLNIEHLSPEIVDEFGAELWCMSPPCQPFTTLGAQKDDEDPRTVGLFSVLNTLKHLICKPRFIFFENVPGFDGSRTQATLRSTLIAEGYLFVDFLMCPTQIGIPNERKRYYLLAELKDPEHSAASSLDEAGIFSSILANSSSLPDNLSLYLDADLGFRQDLAVPRSIFRKHLSYKFDVVQPSSRRTSCFTKGYFRSHRGTGSFLQVSKLAAPLSFPTGELLDATDADVRFFSPRELLRLHGFPERFRFPPHLTLAQQYALIGNSLNVTVVSALLRRLLREKYP